MMNKVWIILFIIFIIYSGVVYKYCDRTICNQPNTSIMAGWDVWQNKNCQSCHQFYGLGGYMGPDLTNIISEKGQLYTKAIIKHGTGKMPDLHLKDNEVNNLISFLTWVDKSGQTKVSDSSLTWTGNYDINR